MPDPLPDPNSPRLRRRPIGTIATWAVPAPSSLVTFVLYSSSGRPPFRGRLAAGMGEWVAGSMVVGITGFGFGLAELLRRERKAVLRGSLRHGMWGWVVVPSPNPLARNYAKP